MKLGGKVFVDEDEIGQFTVDSDDQIVVELNGGRWTVPFAFQWALENKRSLRFEPMIQPH